MNCRKRCGISPMAFLVLFGILCPCKSLVIPRTNGYCHTPIRSEILAFRSIFGYPQSIHLRNGHYKNSILLSKKEDSIEETPQKKKRTLRNLFSRKIDKEELQTEINNITTANATKNETELGVFIQENVESLVNATIHENVSFGNTTQTSLNEPKDAEVKNETEFASFIQENVESLVNATIHENVSFGSNSETSLNETKDVGVVIPMHTNRSQSSVPKSVMPPVSTLEDLASTTKNNKELMPLNNLKKEETQPKRRFWPLSKKDKSQTKSTEVTPSSSKKVKKKRSVRKRILTTISILICCFLAAPVPKRFTLQDEDGNQLYTIRKSQKEAPAPKLDTESITPPKPKITVPVLPPSTEIQTQPSIPIPSPARAATGFVAEAVRKIGPSVVRIDTEVLASSPSPFNPFDVFVDPDTEDDDAIVRSGQGSGIIFSQDGYVLTNAHVVEGANRVYVTLTDGRKFLAEVRGVDDMVDIAVLRILSHAPWGGYAPWGSSPNPNADKPPGEHGWKGPPLPVAAFGDSDSLQVGEFVIAVGNPAGLDNSVTMGIVSSLKRSSEEIGLPGKKVTFIQTDAAVNPGNSGGPLVNEHGQIIGINTCIRANMEGIAFAIPINKAKDIMHQLAAGENIKHGYIGVVMMTVTPDFARQNNMDMNSPAGIMPEVYGVMIERVLQGTPAAEAGLRRFDIMLEIGGVEVNNAVEAARIVDEASIEKNLEVKVLRGGRHLTLSVKPADLSEKLRQRKEAKQREKERRGNIPYPPGGNGGGRIYVLPFPSP